METLILVLFSIAWAKEEHYDKPDEAKYQISMPHDQIKKIQADYQNAVKQFMAEMEKNPILSLG